VLQGRDYQVSERMAVAAMCIANKNVRGLRMSTERFLLDNLPWGIGAVISSSLPNIFQSLSR
jgi:hypothetical protein